MLVLKSYHKLLNEKIRKRDEDRRRRAVGRGGKRMVISSKWPHTRAEKKLNDAVAMLLFARASAWLRKAETSTAKASRRRNE